MARLRPEDLDRIAERTRMAMSLRDGAGRAKITVHMGTCGIAAGARKIMTALLRCAEEPGAKDLIITTSGCAGLCSREPMMTVEVVGQAPVKYADLTEEKVQEIFAEHVTQGRIVARYALAMGSEQEDRNPTKPAALGPVPRMSEIGFFKKQQLIALRNRGLINPEKIDEYIARGGYRALAKALASMSSEEIIREIKKSGLRGRGGAGFPTGLKWELTAKQPGDEKFVICNGDEGDPGAFMDRSIVESDPHAVVEGMLIGAKAIGATHGFVYIRNEYPLALQTLIRALHQARDYGLLGTDVLGTGFNFDISVHRGAGAFVCGEETSLIGSLEGRPPEPRIRPPFPAESGVRGRPTCINNVETWATVSAIINRGAEWFARIGTETSKGTKVFSLVGKVKNTGLVEVPMGITLREMVYDIGGGIQGDRKFKAVQTGGPSGGCIPASLLDLPIDYERLAEAGSIMGSGGMIVMDEDICMVDIARYFLEFLRDESCGKCTACREGLDAMYQIVSDICAGKGQPTDIPLLEELGQAVKDGSLCALGGTAPNSVLSTLRYFRNEYERHVADKRCDAFVCRDLVGAPCQAACPLGTEAWRYVALLEKGQYEQAYQVIRETNPFPSVCARVCDHRCEYRCRLGTSGSQPLAIRALKRFITDHVRPSAGKPAKRAGTAGDAVKVAVIGAGPAGLTAAHDLSRNGYQVTIFEAQNRPGGMLVSGIPAYRLPRDVLHKEIESLLDEDITLKCGTALGRDVTIDSLFAEGFKAVFLAIGAHRSLRLGVEGETVNGVYPAMQFLEAFNLRDEELAKGRVGVIGGGNSAVDAARVALRQKGVEGVTLLYRRSRQEMPAYEEEIEAALEEGVKLETLVSPARIHAADGCLAGIECVRNRLGDVDSSGRGRPVPVPGSEFRIPLDTLVVAVGERPESNDLGPMGVELCKDGTARIDAGTQGTSRQGVFAGGDLVTGPNTVVDAIAAGRKAAAVVDRYLRGRELREPPEVRLPEVFIEPAAVGEEEPQEAARAVPRTLPVESREKSFAEVEMSLSAEQAAREARRCLRCDSEFTRPEAAEAACAAGAGQAT